MDYKCRLPNKMLSQVKETGKRALESQIQESNN